jgi:predicted DNA-binding transcriptional regulator YafY
VVIDPARWGDHTKDRPPLVELLQTAVIRRQRVRLSYASRAGESERLVDPWGLVDKDDVWYLIAGTGKGQRTFRVDRIVDAALTEEPFERPADFDLQATWATIVDDMERRRSGGTATVLLDPKHLHVLIDQFGRQSEILDPAPDGRARVRVTAPLPNMIAQVLAGWGALIDVVDSPAVQAELARIGAELTARYGA